MAERAYVYSGAFVGSTEVKVRCFDSNGTTIYLYQGDSQLGIEALDSSDAVFTISPLQYSPDGLIAYVDEIGNRTGGITPISLKDDTKEYTGWKTPQSVSIDGQADISYEDWKTATGLELPDVYEPSLMVNNNPLVDSLLSFANAKISFDLVINNNAGNCIVTVTNVVNSQGGFTIKFDTGIIGSNTTKTYTTAGTYQVTVTDIADNSNSITKTYTLAPTAPTTPSTSAIEVFWIDMSFLDSGERVGFVAGYCSSQLQYKIDGYAGDVWLDGEGGSNNRWYKIFGNLASGTTITVRVRVKSNTSDTKSLTKYIL